MSFPRARLTRFNERTGDVPPVGAYNPRFLNHTPTPKFRAPRDPSSLSSSRPSTPGGSFRVPHASVAELVRGLEERDALIAQLRSTKSRLGARASQLEALLRGLRQKAKRGGDATQNTPRMLEMSDELGHLEEDPPEPAVRLSCGTDELKAKMQQFIEGQGPVGEEESQGKLTKVLEEQENRNAIFQKENDHLEEESELQREKFVALQAGWNEREKQLIETLEKQERENTNLQTAKGRLEQDLEFEKEKFVALEAGWNEKEKELMETLEKQERENTNLQTAKGRLEQDLELEKEKFVALQARWNERETELMETLGKQERENTNLQTAKGRLEQDLELEKAKFVALEARWNEKEKELMEVLEEQQRKNATLEEAKEQLFAAHEEIKTLLMLKVELLSTIDHLKCLVSSKNEEVLVLVDSKLSLQEELIGTQQCVAKLRSALAEEEATNKGCLLQKDMEVDLLRTEVAELADQLRLANQTKCKLDLLCESAKESLKLLQAENARLQLLQKSTEDDLLAARSRGDKYKVVCREIECQKGELEEKLRALSKQPDRYAAQVEQLMTQLTQMQEQVDSWRSKYEAIEVSWAQYQELVQSYELEVHVLEQQKQATESEVAQLKEAVTKSLGHQNHRQKISYLRKILDERNNYKQELALQQAIIDSLEKKIAKLENKSFAQPKHALKENVEPSRD